MCTHSGTICPSSYGSPVRQQVLRDVTRHFNQPFGNLPGFEHRRVIHQKNFSGVALSHKPHLIFGESSPLRKGGPNKIIDLLVVRAHAVEEDLSPLLGVSLGWVLPIHTPP